jgi:hypothetical protein
MKMSSMTRARQGLISPDEALEARAAATEVVRAMRSHFEPFGSLGWSRLDEAILRSRNCVT